MNIYKHLDLIAKGKFKVLSSEICGEQISGKYMLSCDDLHRRYQFNAIEALPALKEYKHIVSYSGYGNKTQVNSISFEWTIFAKWWPVFKSDIRDERNFSELVLKSLAIGAEERYFFSREVKMSKEAFLSLSWFGMLTYLSCVPEVKEKRAAWFWTLQEQIQGQEITHTLHKFINNGIINRNS